MSTSARRVLSVALLALALVGCQVSREAGADPVTFALGQQFTLGGGQEAVFGGGDLSVRFSELLEDSRCPTEVECFWTGQARIAVIVHAIGRPSTTAYFNTNPAPGENVESVRAGDYAVELTSLEPYPRTPDDPIPFEDYRATLVVAR
ncbi:hypothetical protein [Mycobacterium sp. ITM-2016-00318]|uniref:hypothetical protein n=1 Tax=Mycobacterium sp. ITM-2016-00318 TaxID=2099693 RepID=UPI000CF950D4|nr:hypothetical protein [Mycobacterium sp. ITM-2016-00318]WNG92541.1 hypothetical protein C6A82_024665 [Mycobacterium sp. ITM-2016-00318]